MLGHINTGTAARHRQKPDSVYREHFEQHPDPILENATIEEIELTPAEMLFSNVPMSELYVKTERGADGVTRVLPGTFYKAPCGLDNAWMAAAHAKGSPPEFKPFTLGSSSAERTTRVYPDFGNDRDRYKVAGYAGEQLPKDRPFEHVQHAAVDYSYLWLIPMTLGMLLLLFWVLDQV